MLDDASLNRRFLSVEQVAEELNVGLPLVRALLKAGHLRGIQIGGRGLWRVASVDLDAYIGQAYETTAERIKSGEFADDPELSQSHGAETDGR